MSFGLCYWILMLVWLVFSLWSAWPTGLRQGGPSLLLFILLVLLGWKVFGPPIHP